MPQKKSLPAGFAPIIVLTISALVVAALGLIWINQNQNSTIANLPSPPPDPTVDWKTYTSTKYGFELKYPSGYSLQELGPNQAESDLEAGKQISGTSPPEYRLIEFTDSRKNQDFSVHIYHKPTSRLDSNYILGGECGTQFAKEPSINEYVRVGQIDFVHREQAPFNPDEKSPVIQIDYCFISGTGNLVTIRFGEHNNDLSGIHQFINKILIGLKLIFNTQLSPTPDPTVDWKTYKNDIYKFTLRYPTDWNLWVNPKTPKETPLSSGTILVLSKEDSSLGIYPFIPPYGITGGTIREETIPTRLGSKPVNRIRSVWAKEDSEAPGISVADEHILAKVDGKVFFFHIKYKDGLFNQYVSDTFDQILSTFRFD